MTTEVKGNRVNREIKSNRVILIDETGKQLGEFLTRDALKIASEKGLDLMEVNSGETPVCKILDYGKWVYQQKKRHSNKPRKIKTKEINLSPVIGEHDFNVKMKHAREFLERGDNVKISIVFHGRQNYHPDIGKEQSNKILELLADVSNVESPPKMAGNSIMMLLTKK